MSLTNPTTEVKVNSVAIATQNILNVNIHLGCTREVNSFEVIVNNSNPDYFGGQYAKGGAKEFTKGHSVTIKIKRGTIDSDTNYLITGNLESLEYTDQKEEYQYRDIVILRGRCTGQRLFARKYNGDLIADVGTGYMNYNRTAGDASSLVAHLIDFYTYNEGDVPLSHVRVTDDLASNAASGQKDVIVTDGSKFTAGRLVVIKDDNAWEYNKIASIASNTLTMSNNLVNSYTTAANCIVGLDLIYTSNTQFTKMEFEYETVFDIIKFIADTTSTGVVIGFDARIEYDGKFSFRSLNAGTESYSLSEECQVERYIDDATRIKNSIKVFGKADKPYPLAALDGQSWSDIWTEDITSDVAQLTEDVAIDQDYLKSAVGMVGRFVADDYVTVIAAADWTDQIGEVKQVDRVVESGNTSDLTSDASSGQKVVNVVDGSQFDVGDIVDISDDTPQTEENRIDSISSNELTMENNLANTYTTAQNAKVDQVDYVVYLTEAVTKVYDASHGLGEAIIAQVFSDGGWAYVPFSQWDVNAVSKEGTSPIYEGSYSIEVAFNANLTPAIPILTLQDSIDITDYTRLVGRFYFNTTAPSYILIKLIDDDGGTATHTRLTGFQEDNWQEIKVDLGPNNEDGWYLTGGFDWTEVRVISFYIFYAVAGNDSFYIDRLFIGGKRWGGISGGGYAVDATSQSAHGVWEHVVFNDGLLSDAECEAKAQALLLYYKEARTTIELESRTLDLVDYPIIPGNKVAVNLPLHSISGNYRIDSCDINCNADDNELSFRFTLETTPPKIADYLYFIYKKLGGLERYGK